MPFIKNLYQSFFTSRATHNENDALDKINHQFKKWEEWSEKANNEIGEKRHIALNILKECAFMKNDYLDLSGLKLTSLPDNFPSKVKILNLSDNNLTEYPKNKNLPEFIRELNLSDNKLSFITQDLHINLENLYLYNNKIDNISECVNEIYLINPKIKIHYGYYPNMGYESSIDINNRMNLLRNPSYSKYLSDYDIPPPPRAIKASESDYDIPPPPRTIRASEITR